MEERKIKEIEYYDKKAEAYSGQGDFEGFEPQALSSFRFLYQLVGENCRGKIVLDYGCGNGIHSFFPVKMGAEKVVGIDLSEKSLEIARKKAREQGLQEKVEFIRMDCEKMDFPDNSFDLIMDSGTFSSLDLDKAYPELARILRPKGLLIGVETFGHNPFTNLKRALNKITGKRTGWVVEHIFREKELKGAKKYFDRIEAKYFHLISWLAFPFLSLPGAKFLLKSLEAIDKILLKLPFLRKYAFKVVFIFSKS